MSNSETKILRDGIARLVAYVRRLEGTVSKDRAQYAYLAARYRALAHAAVGIKRGGA